MYGTNIEKYIGTRTTWTKHNADGTIRDPRIEASMDVNIWWNQSNRQIGRLSVSGSYNAPRIERVATVSGASIRYSLQPSKTNRINFNLSGSSSSHSHYISLFSGGTFMGEWNTGGNPSSINLNGTHINRLIDQMPNSTSKAFTLKVSSSVGGSYIGQTSTSVTGYIHTSVTPSISSISYNPTPTNDYVEGNSRVKTSFTSTPSRGSTMTSRRTELTGPKSGRSVFGGVSGNTMSGTSGILAHSGTYTLAFTATDSRGRSNTAYRTINVKSYTNPDVDRLIAERTSGENLNISFNLSYDTFGGTNSVSYTLESQERGSSNSTKTTLETGSNTSGTLNHSKSFSGFKQNTAYIITLKLNDSFGTNSSRTTIVSTARQLLTLNQDKGVGIGKYHERGELDVQGDVYFSGNINIIPEDVGSDHTQYILNANTTSPNDVGEIALANMDGNTVFRLGNYSRSGNSGFMAVNRDLQLESMNGVVAIRGDAGVFVSDGTSSYGYSIASYGENANGYFVRFYDGTQICWQNQIDINDWATSGHAHGHGYLYYHWNFPATFPMGNVYINATQNDYLGSSNDSLSLRFKVHTDYSTIYVVDGVRSSGVASGSSIAGVKAMAIGRWR